MASTIYIIYNARASITGKLNYAYRKLTSSSSPCAACDLTHGGLRLTETAEWTTTKQQIGAEVQQLHIDELPSEIVDFTKINGIKYPAVLGETEGSEMRLLLTKDELLACGGDHGKFLEGLREKAEREGVVLQHGIAGYS